MKKEKFKVDFIEIGDAKSASSWIYDALKEHPEICMSKVPETNFFTRFYHKGIKYYRRFFCNYSKNKKIGEVSPRYLHNPKTALRIKKHNPKTKILCCLRNPITKIYSGYWYDRISGTGSTLIYSCFEDAINNKIFLKRHFLYEKLERYFNVFSKNQILVVIFDDLKKDPNKFISKIYRFLGVKDSFTPSIIKEKVNETGSIVMKYPNLMRLIFTIKAKIESYRLTEKIFKKISPRLYSIFRKIHPRNKKKANYKFKKPPMKEKTRKRLKKIYMKDIKKIEQLIGKDLSLWYNEKH